MTIELDHVIRRGRSLTSAGMGSHSMLKREMISEEVNMMAAEICGEGFRVGQWLGSAASWVAE